MRVGIVRVANGALAVICALWGGASAATAQEDDEFGWFSSTEVSFVFTEGNSDTETIGINSVAGKRMESSRFQIDVTAIRSDTADDRFLLVDEGLTWLPGETPAPGGVSVVEPPTEPDVEKYAVGGYYDRRVNDKLSWRTGGGWDRNEDAGILNRYVAYGGLGHSWRDTKDLRLYTGYALSYTDREEEEPDSEKEEEFLGARLTVEYLDTFGSNATFRADFNGNFSLEDSNDYNLDFLTSLTTQFFERLSLRVSLQWQYANEPALEDVDVVARAILVDPNAIPGDGDEFFQTVTSGGAEIELGEDSIRKEKLDTIFRASVVIDF